MKKLVFIQPSSKNNTDSVLNKIGLNTIKRALPDNRLKNHLADKKAAYIPGTSLMILSALTPRNMFDVEFIDERIEPVNYDCNADLVAITAHTTNVIHASEIANSYRKRGATVVMGGIHPTVCSDEVLQYADAVVVGEAEYIWQELLNDYLRGHMKKTYQAGKYVDMANDYVLPDNSILKKEYYLFDNSIELSRGCPHKCKFCSDPLVYGENYRVRDLNEVISQIENTESDYIYFADDNVIGRPNFAKEMLTQLKSLDKRWFGAASTLLSRDHDLMDLVIESGCKYLVIGFESSSNEILMQLKKRHNIGENYSHFVKYMQDNGVIIAGCFILGFENESAQSISDQYKYAQELGILVYNPSVLTPYPGTPYYDEFKKEGRLLHEDWSKYYAKSGVPVYYSENHTPEYLHRLKSAVTGNLVTFFLKQIRKSGSYSIQKFGN